MILNHQKQIKSYGVTYSACVKGKQQQVDQDFSSLHPPTLPPTFQSTIPAFHLELQYGLTVIRLFFFDADGIEVPLGIVMT